MIDRVKILLLYLANNVPHVCKHDRKIPGICFWFLALLHNKTKCQHVKKKKKKKRIALQNLGTISYCQEAHSRSYEWEQECSNIE